ncbi:unnamed protein product [Periconia digitata]|uniref:Uncharacterized protein n=1 Tax=Periconia digitata TaxID=1303443 RepID=A0A9W4UGW0_9PLEO|nr:unnamed protein product [Periconia digitata]
MSTNPPLDQKTIRLAFYPSAHGLGHFMRLVHLAQLLLEATASRQPTTNTTSKTDQEKSRPNYHIYVRTNVSPSILASLGAGWPDIDSHPITFSPYTHPLQPTVVQTNPYTLSASQTFDSVIRFNTAAALAQEEAFVEEHGIDAIVSDCPSIVCTIKNTPSILVTNFLFDTILQGLIDLSTSEKLSATNPPHPHEEEEEETTTKVKQFVREMTAQYAQASTLLLLPGAIPSTYKGRTIPLPFHYRRTASNSRVQTLSSLPPTTIPPSHLAHVLLPTTKILLHTFGGQPPSSSTATPLLPHNWIVLSQTLHFPSSRIYRIHSDAYIPSLIAASDAVLGKLGWGMCSEVLGNGKVPFVYVPREAFVEEKGLVEWMGREHGGVVRMEGEVFEGGDWRGVLGEIEGSRRGRGVEEMRDEDGERDGEVVRVFEEEVARVLRVGKGGEVWCDELCL